MTENEQIEEMSRIIGHCESTLHPDIKCHSREHGCYCAENPCYNELVAARLYSKGYRKASEVAREIFGELEASFCILAYPVVTAVGTINTERAEGLHIRTEDYETIKKKYTEGEK